MAKFVYALNLSSISANLGVVTAGKIQDSTSESYWDLDNGEIVLNVKSLTINAKEVATQDDIDGIKSWTVQIFSTNGGVFKNDQISTVLIARVYRGTEDITDTLDANRFRWTRVSNDSAADELWNSANFGGKKEISVTSDDVHQRATFNVTILEEV